MSTRTNSAAERERIAARCDESAAFLDDRYSRARCDLREAAALLRATTSAEAVKEACARVAENFGAVVDPIGDGDTYYPAFNLEIGDAIRALDLTSIKETPNADR